MSDFSEMTPLVCVAQLVARSSPHECFPVSPDKRNTVFQLTVRIYVHYIVSYIKQGTTYFGVRWVNPKRILYFKV